MLESGTPNRPLSSLLYRKSVLVLSRDSWRLAWSCWISLTTRPGLLRTYTILDTIKTIWPKSYASTSKISTSILVLLLLADPLKQLYGCQRSSSAPCTVGSPAYVSPLRTSWVMLTMTGTLMNHTNIMQNLAPQIKRAENLAYLGLPYTLGELNSIANQGVNGETNVFGDALWLVDFSLWAAVHVRATNLSNTIHNKALTLSRVSSACSSTKGWTTVTPRGSQSRAKDCPQLRDPRTTVRSWLPVPSDNLRTPALSIFLCRRIPSPHMPSTMEINCRSWLWRICGLSTRLLQIDLTGNTNSTCPHSIKALGSNVWLAQAVMRLIILRSVVFHMIMHWMGGSQSNRIWTKRQGFRMGCLLFSFRTLPPFFSLYDLLHLGRAGTPYISTI